MIIVEGMDNTGKSTLAKLFGLDVVHPGPAPRSYEHGIQCLDSQLQLCNKPIVMDRVTCISDPIYRDRGLQKLYEQYRLQMLKTVHCVVVYCRPPDNVVLNNSTHKPKSYDTPKHLEDLKKNGARYLRLYDAAMRHIPHVKYDYTRDNSAQLVEDLLCTQFIIGEWKKWMHLHSTQTHG